MDAIGIQAGMNVGEIGAGNGRFAVRVETGWEQPEWSTPMISIPRLFVL
ncbi:MAG: hypothetical protein GF421_08435 [Candidatus Aminicenantes bacterium]|nr:hypothetical protein [Candidatus Aminicenantes bacterium]